MQENIKKLYEKDHLTQKDIIQLLLHNTQHMVTREELKDDNRELKSDIKEEVRKLDKKIDDCFVTLDKKIDDSFNKLDKKIDDNIDRLDKRIEKLDGKIDKVEKKFDRLQWFLFAGIITILFKDKLVEIINYFFD